MPRKLLLRHHNRFALMSSFLQELRSHHITAVFCHHFTDVSDQNSHLWVQEEVTVSRFSVSSCPPNFLNVALKALKKKVDKETD